MKAKQWLAGFLAILLCFSCLSAGAVTVNATEKSGGTISLYGKFYDMGYQFEQLNQLNDAVKITVTDSQGNKTNSTFSNGEYAIDLNVNETYRIDYSAYIGGRMANLKLAFKYYADANKELNLVVRTQNVAGLEEGFNTYPCPANSVVFDDSLTQPMIVDDSIDFDKDKYSVKLNDTDKKTEINTSSGIIYSSDRYTYQSSDENIAKIDANGKIIPVSKGTVTITATLEKNDESSEVLTATTTVEVKNGFDYAVDGYCFLNMGELFYEESVTADDNDGVVYAIPYERYQEVFGKNVTKNYWEMFLKENWWGNCFGMSVSAILFYNQKLDPMDYGVSNYNENKTINSGMYEAIEPIDAEKSRYTPRLNYSNKNGCSEFTKMIECYQIWEKEPNWKEEYDVPDFNEIIANWESGKTYLISLHTTDYHHTVVLDTSGAVPVKNNDGMYELLVYDPNYPAFTDDVSYNMVSYSGSNLLYSPNKNGKPYFKIEGANNSSENKKTYIGEDITFYNVDNIPTSFDGSATLLDKVKLYISVILPEGSVETDFDNIEQAILIYNTPDDELTIGDRIFKLLYKVDPDKVDMDTIDDWYIDYMSSGDGGTEMRIYPNCDIEDMDTVLENIEIEISEGVKVSCAGGDTIGAVSTDGSATITFEDGAMKVLSTEGGNVEILAENHAEDGTISSVLAEGESAAGNEITVSMSNENYNVTSKESTKLDLTFNTDDSNVEETVSVIAGEKEVTVDVQEYVEDPENNEISSDNTMNDNNNTNGDNNSNDGTNDNNKPEDGKKPENTEIPENGWAVIDGKEYWYENGVRQGYDPENPAYRGKEIYDPASDAWYWLDNVQEGAKAVSKDVYQESDAGSWADRLDGTGKWVRYDAKGRMIKGWQTTDAGTYYFDLIYGTMAKGFATIDGREYYFNPNTGILEREIGEVPEFGWKNIDGKEYWYEGYQRQGIHIDAAYRGKEIYDPNSDAWYWLDNIQGGAKAVSKDVYQESLAGDWAENKENGTGKWVRYDAEGHMIKGWQTTEAGTYYFDLTYGTMAKGMVEIDGQTYVFDNVTGQLMN